MMYVVRPDYLLKLVWVDRPVPTVGNGVHGNTPQSGSTAYLVPEHVSFTTNDYFLSTMGMG
jgi:hypothetical protein